ncbi:MAG: phosphoribosylformylglycinamidine cyclo-ligase [Gammaproteobacteria bacterium]
MPLLPVSSRDQSPLTYEDAGVSVDRGDRLIDRIKAIADRTQRPGVMGRLGGFGALFDLSKLDYRQPILVSTTDGVGTKLKLALAMGKHDTIGIDLVAMCVNDLIVQGAEPLFFLDYYACARLDVDLATEVISGIAHGCELAGTALVGGETAEMPDLYAVGDYDLAGFCVGIVERDDCIDGRQVTIGDALIGVASNGPHANGYSLIRKVIARGKADLEQDFFGEPLGAVLLEPTRVYVQPIRQLIVKVPVHGLAHITGGGLIENIPRMLPSTACANINASTWDHPPIFQWLQEKGRIKTKEMYRTFNCGIGMVACIAEENVQDALRCLQDSGERAWRIGTVEARREESVRIENTG